MERESTQRLRNCCAQAKTCTGRTWWGSTDSAVQHNAKKTHLCKRASKAKRLGYCITTEDFHHLRVPTCFKPIKPLKEACRPETLLPGIKMKRRKLDTASSEQRQSQPPHARQQPRSVPWP